MKRFDEFGDEKKTFIHKLTLIQDRTVAFHERRRSQDHSGGGDGGGGGCNGGVRRRKSGASINSR